MKKTLLILCALLLTAVGASAQTAYEFTPTNWVSCDASRITENDIEYNTDGTITLTAGDQYGWYSYANCIALGNMSSMATTGSNTSNYYITSEQKYFVVKGKDLSKTSTDSYLWWMNGYNNGMQASPDYIVELTEETTGEATGEVLFAWDCSSYLTAGSDGNITLSGGTCFGLTSTDETNHKSTISYIGFYTEDEIDELVTATPYVFLNTNWVELTDHPNSTAVASDNNTITITTTANSTTSIGLCNGNDAPYNTADYYVTKDQCWFVIVGTNLSTAESASILWWMNGYNEGMTIAPTETATLEDGQIALAWDLSQSVAGTYLQNEKNTLSGFTCFGLTSTSTTTVISDICYYTFDEMVEEYPELDQRTPYEFVNSDWVILSDHTDATAVANEDNTITITTTANSTTSMGITNGNNPYTTANYYVTNEQSWFIVVGTNLSTAEGASELWWMDGANWGSWAPTKVVTLSDGQVFVAWDLSTMTEIDVNLQNEKNTLSGWTCFGLTSTTGESVISNINFYTWDEVIEVYPELDTRTPYEFVCTDWGSMDTGRVADANVTHNETNNTITVEASGTNNVALSNGREAPYTTANYYVTSEQSWFIVVGTNLSTASGDSKLWWMDGANWGEWDPTKVVTLSDGQVLVAWDLSTMTEIDVNLQNEKNTLSGWTGFGLTSTTGSSVISDINFYTENEAHSMIDGTTHFCTANESHWSSSDDAAFWVDTAEKDDGSGMEPPFLTYYVNEAEGATLSDATFTHETLTLEPGLYEVSMQIRVIDYDEGQTVGEGTLFSATTGSTTVSQDIELGVDATETTFNDGGDRDDIYGTYTLYVKVEADNESETGSLTVSLTVKDATYNWIMWKNLTVRLLGEDEEIPSGTVSGSLSAEYGTLILPFDATLPDGLTAYTAGEVTKGEDGDDELTLTEVTGGKLTAGTPYIIGGTSSSEYSFSGVPTKYEVSYTEGLLTGTFVDMSLANGDFTADAGQYVLQNHEQGGLAFYPITSESEDVTLSAYHCYLTYTSTSPTKLSIGFVGSDVETGIETVEAVEGVEAANGTIYDLSGRKVSKAVKGVYIMNGKKVLVK